MTIRLLTAPSPLPSPTLEQGSLAATIAAIAPVHGAREMDAMGFWCQSLFYYYKECLGPLGKVHEDPQPERRTP